MTRATFSHSEFLNPGILQIGVCWEIWISAAFRHQEILQLSSSFYTHAHTSREQLLLCTKNYHLSLCFDGLPRGLSGKKKKKNIFNPPANAGLIGGASSVPKSGRSPGGRNGNPLQYSCLENPMDRGAWWATEPDTSEWLSTRAHTLCFDRKMWKGVRVWLWG